MYNYNELTNICKTNSEMFRKVVEDFLFNNVVNNKKLADEILVSFSPYRHITGIFEKKYYHMFINQFIMFKIFKKDGLIKKYLNHSAVQRLPQNERDYLHKLTKYPWKFSFSKITGSPEERFFEMKDVFTGESFLLHSPGVSDLISKQGVSLWLNLIGYNGQCWQSFGPINAYKAFTSDDILFFSDKLYPQERILTREEIIEKIEKNPVPYMMLVSGAEYPVVFHGDEQIFQITAEYNIDSFNAKGLDKDFKVEYSNEIYRLSLKGWDFHPHFCSAYYDEKKKILLLYSMTDRGFNELVSCLNRIGYDFTIDPDIRVTTAMMTTAEKILRKKIRLNEYDSLFSKETSKEEKEELSKLNKFMKLVLPYINTGQPLDVKYLAQEAGLDEETAKDILKQVMKKFG